MRGAGVALSRILPSSSRRRARAAVFTFCGSSPNMQFAGNGLADAIERADFQRRDGGLGASLVRLETMITGVGRSRMILSRKSSPFIFGISMSSVTTSGLSALIARAPQGDRPPRR